MPSFNFLPLNQLKDNTENLLDEVRAKHEETKTEITDPRRTQVDLLDGLHAELIKLTALVNNGDIEAQYTENLESINKKLAELNEITELTKEQKVLQKQLERNKITVLKYMSELALANLKSDEQVDNQDSRMLNDQYRAMIFTGAYLTIEKEIDVEYSGVLNALLGVVKKNTPDNSVLYAGIDAAIGVTAENPMDEKSRLQALAAYQHFVIRNNVMNVKLAEDVKDENIKSAVNAKLKLKNVAQPVDRAGRLVLEDSTNAAQLLPTQRLVAQSQDNKLPGNTMKMVAAQLATYTPNSEVGRYHRNEKSAANHDSMQAIVRLTDKCEPKEYENEKSDPSVTKDGRDATAEERMAYEITDKIYTVKKIRDKESVKVLSGWKGGYKAEDKAKSKWNEVKDSDNVLDNIKNDDMVQETKYADETKETKVKVDVSHAAKRFEAFNFFTANTKAKIEAANINKMKHANTKVTNVVQVPDDYDTKARPISPRFKK